MKRRHDSPEPIMNLAPPSSSEPGDSTPRAPFHRRMRLFQAVVVLVFALLCLQLWRLQITHGEEYRRHADLNRFRVLLSDSPRGVIYDRQGELLVENVPSLSVILVPGDLPEEQEEAVLARLSDLLGLPLTSDKYEGSAQDPHSSSSDRARDSRPGLKKHFFGPLQT